MHIYQKNIFHNNRIRKTSLDTYIDERFFGKCLSDPLSTLGQESSGPISPLGVRVGSRVVGL